LQPENVWVAVSGAVDRNELVSLLDKNFSAWNAPVQTLLDIPSLPEPPTGRFHVVHKEIPQTTILLGHPGINKDNPDMFALRVANYILGGGGFNSRMMREIRSNRGLAYSVYSYFKIGRRLPELFVVSSETKCPTTAEVLTVMKQLMRQIREEPVTEAELELAKKSLINSFVFAFNDTHSIVSRKVRLDFFDYPEGFLETYREKLAAVTVEDVQRVAREYLQPEQLQIVLVGNKNAFVDDLPSFGMPVEEVQL
jgi:zinc protease